MKAITALAALGILTVPAVAPAKDKTDPLLQAMMACKVVTPDAARLLCYDQAALALNQAVERGDVRVEAERGPRLFEGVVRASGQDGENRFWIELENGDRWQLLPSTNRSRPPQPGARVKIRRNFLNSAYWISGDGWAESRGRFINSVP
jgi:hypothetical protein